MPCLLWARLPALSLFCPSFTRPLSASSSAPCCVPSTLDCAPLGRPDVCTSQKPPAESTLQAVWQLGHVHFLWVGSRQVEIILQLTGGLDHNRKLQPSHGRWCCLPGWLVFIFCSVPPYLYSLLLVVFSSSTSVSSLCLPCLDFLILDCPCLSLCHSLSSSLSHFPYPWPLPA